MTKKDLATAESAKPTPSLGIVLELEFLLFAGRRLLFAAYSSVLKKHSINLDPMLFTRYCQKRKIEKSLKGLLPALDKKGLAEKEKDIAAKIMEQFCAALTAPANLPASPLLDFLQKAAGRNIKIGLLSFLPEESAQQLMTRLALNPPACLYVMQKEADDLPTPDGWLSLLKTMAVTPRGVVALVDGAQACKSALTVGMRCVVLPDAFTAWQDFGGADLVLESASELKLDNLLALLSPAPYRTTAK